MRVVPYMQAVEVLCLLPHVGQLLEGAMVRGQEAVAEHRQAGQQVDENTARKGRGPGGGGGGDTHHLLAGEGGGERGALGADGQE